MDPDQQILELKKQMKQLELNKHQQKPIDNTNQEERKG
jgi:hypothetical protein